MSALEEKRLPLAGIRVVEFTHMVMGPTCGMVLADLGAEVIKVEPIEGDRTRQLLGAGAGFFPMFNRNKKSIALDLRHPQGLEAALRLCAGADVVAQNFKPGTMGKYGLDYAALRRLTRRLPARPDPHAILGTAFHDWVQRFYGAERLFDLDDLPGAGDPQNADAAGLAALQAAFTASAWAARTPLDVEVPFELVLAGTVVRGRIDAVFPDADGGVTVVDWKTGEPPADEQARRHVAVQLAVYRLAWAGLSGRPVSSVRAAFHYVRSGRTVEPGKLYDAAELAELLTPDELVLTPGAERCAESPAPG